MSEKQVTWEFAEFVMAAAARIRHCINKAVKQLIAICISYLVLSFWLIAGWSLLLSSAEFKSMSWVFALFGAPQPCLARTSETSSSPASFSRESTRYEYLQKHVGLESLWPMSFKIEANIMWLLGRYYNDPSISLMNFIRRSQLLWADACVIDSEPRPWLLKWLVDWSSLSGTGWSWNAEVQCSTLCLSFFLGSGECKEPTRR